MSNPSEKVVETRDVMGYKVTIMEVIFPGETPLYDLYAGECLTMDGSLDHYPTDEDLVTFLAPWASRHSAAYNEAFDRAYSEAWGRGLSADECADFATLAASSEEER